MKDIFKISRFVSPLTLLVVWVAYHRYPSPEMLAAVSVGLLVIIMLSVLTDLVRAR